MDGWTALLVLVVVAGNATGLLWPDVAGRPSLARALAVEATSALLAVGGFLVTQALLDELGRDTFDPLRFYARRVVRLGPPLALVCVAVWIANAYAGALRFSSLEMTHNVVGVLSYTLNVAEVQDLFATNPAFSHLWYFCVQQQCYLVLPLGLLLLVRVRWLAFVLTLVLIGLVAVNRYEVIADQGWRVASVATTTRADGLLWGVALALALPLARRVRGWTHLLWILLIAVAALGAATSQLATDTDLSWWSLAFAVVAGLVVVSIWLLPRPTRVSRLLALRPMQWLGRASLAIYLWHVPVFVVVREHTSAWPWWWRTALALGILVVLVVLTVRLVDGPSRRLLATRQLFRIRPPADEPVAPQVA